MWDPAATDVEVVPLPPGVVVEKDQYIAMDDGVRLCANVFRPPSSTPAPVLLALTPYGKDVSPERHSVQLDCEWRSLGLTLGRVRISEDTPWEAPDPGYWVPYGYAVVHVDLRGFFKSEGEPRMFSRTEVRDYLQLIEWAGTQPWSNGNVGLAGVSYLAIAQWYAAAHDPPHLKAICPWEGASDPYRDVMFHGGIPETAFMRLWSASASRGARGARGGGGDTSTSLPSGPTRTPLIQEVPLNVPALEDIRVPALICGSFSDQGLHSKGCFDAYMRISSRHKWLYTHGGGKWERFYGEEALTYQRMFFNHFLKGVGNGMEGRPSVRLEVRETRDEYAVREEWTWPLEDTRYRYAFLDARDTTLKLERPERKAAISYDSTAGEGVRFELRFAEATELTGHMKLKLWVSTDAGEDMDLVVGIRKLNVDRQTVPFWGPEKDPIGVVSRGWLRVSHRELDEARSRPYQPVLRHEREQQIKPGEIVPVEIEILPSSTYFDAGESLQLVVRGTDAYGTALHRHERLCNRGCHSIHTGGSFDSHLLLPFIE